MADIVGEQYLPPNAGVIRDQILQDMRLGAIAEGLTEPPTGPKSDNYINATAFANVCLIGLQNQKVQNENVSVLDARGTALDKIRQEEGLPQVFASGSSGKIRPTINGSTTIVEGQRAITANGTRIEVVKTYLNPSDGDLISVKALDTGKGTNAKGGTAVRFISPPSNVDTNAIVSYPNPLTGGTDGESDDRKRTRILNKRQSGPAGSWGHTRELVLNADPSIQDCYVYPALGGPASKKVVPVRAMDLDEYEFTRVCSDAQLLNARKAIYSQHPDAVEIVIQAAVDQAVDFGLELTIPNASLTAGSGTGGWLDPSPWPVLEAGDSGRVTISSIAQNGKQITVSAQTTTSPVALNTNIAWWSTVDMMFYVGLVTDVSGSSGAWVLTLQSPFRDHNGDACAAGEYICPAAENIIGYGKEWVKLFGAFGPSENSSSSDVTDRAFRHPKVSVERPSDWADVLLSKISDKYPEITAISRVYASATAATVPASRDTGPSILIMGDFGVYPTS